MGFLFKRKNSKYWQANYKDASGRERYASTGTTSKREAQNHLASLVAEQNRLRQQGLSDSDPLLEILQKAVSEARKGLLTPARLQVHLRKVSVITNGVAQESMTLRGWVESWLRSKRPLVGDSTYYRYQTNLDAVMEKLGAVAEGDMHAITPEQVEAVVRSFRSEGSRASTVNLKLADLRSTLEDARNRGFVERNVAKLVHKLPEEDSIVRAPFTLGEVRQLLAGAGHEWRGCILFAAYTGLRLMNVVGISAKDIDPMKKLLTIQMKKRKRGSKLKILQIPLTDPVFDWFKAAKLTEMSSDPLFPVLSTLPNSTLSTQFARLMTKTGVAREIELPGGVAARRSFHCLRHTFVTWLAESDVSPEIRKRLAGHTTDKVHEIYTHRSTDALAAAIGGLPDINSPTIPS
ncbi:MAG: site-specific integrase [Luteolibacter sp.]